MAEEGKGVALAILGVVAVIAVVGLVLLFKGATGKMSEGGSGDPKVYTRQSEIGHSSGAADVENPYYGYEYETYAGNTQSRYGTGKAYSPGGAWDQSGVYGARSFDAASEPGANSAPMIEEYTTQAPTYKRAPQSIPSGQNDACGGCPYGSYCVPDPNDRPSHWEDVPGYPGCGTIG